MTPTTTDSSTATEPRLRRITRHLTGAAVVTLSTLVANALAYLFFLWINRTQQASDIGVIAATLNLVVICGVPGLAIQLVVARHVAGLHRANREDLAASAHEALWTGLSVGLALTVLTTLASPLIHAGLRLDSWVPIIALALSLPPACVTFAAQGYFHGRQRFVALGCLAVASAGGRFVAAPLGSAWDLGSSGVLVVTAIGGLLVSLVAVTAVLRSASRRSRPPIAGTVREVLQATGSTAALIIVANLDNPLARATLSGDDAGHYAVLSIFSKAAFWGPAFIVTLVFPIMARSAARRHVLRVAAATAAIALVAVAVTWVLQDPLVAIAGGADFAQLAPQVPLFTAVGASWSLGQVLLYWGLARRDHRFGTMAWVVVAVVVGVTLLRESLTVASLATSLLSGGLAYCALGIVLVSVRRSRTQD